MLEVLKEVWPLAAVALLYALGWLMQKEASSFTSRQRLPWDQCVHELFSYHRKFVVRITTAKLPKDIAGFSIAHSGKYSLTLSRRLTPKEREFFSAVTLSKLMDEQADDSHIIAVDRKLTLNEVRRAEALLAELSLCSRTRRFIPLNNILFHLVSPIAQIKRNVSRLGIQIKKVMRASFVNWSAEAYLKRTPWIIVPSILTAVIVAIAGPLGGLAAVGVIGSSQPVPTPAPSTATPRITALVIHQEVGDHAIEGTTPNDIGGVYRELEQYDNALENYQLTGHDGQWESSAAISPDGKMLAAGGDDGTVMLSDPQSRQQIGEPLRIHGGLVTSVTFSPDGKMLAAGGDDGTVILWDTQSHQQIGEPLNTHGLGESSAAISPDGKMLAAGGDDGTVILWDTQSRQQIGEPLRDHGDSGVRSLAFSPDSRILAAGGGGTVILWDTQSRQQMGEPLQIPGSWVDNIAFSSDGRILASIWRVGPGSITAR